MQRKCNWKWSSGDGGSDGEVMVVMGVMAPISDPRPQVNTYSEILTIIRFNQAFEIPIQN